MEKLLLLKILWLLLVGCVCGRDHPHHKEITSELQDRVHHLEELVASQIESHETLRASLRREAERRITLEALLERTFHEERAKDEGLSALLKVTSDRVEALDTSLQEEIRLREESEIKGAEALLKVSKKVILVERDLGQLTLIKSRQRELEDQEDIQNEDIQNLQNTISHVRKSVTRDHREIQELQANAKASASTSSENARLIADFNSRLHQLNSWLHLHNETSAQERELLRDVKSSVFHLTESLTEIQDSFSNLTNGVANLHKTNPAISLKLCPTGYRKVGVDCLQLVELKTSWESSRKKCEELGISAGGNGDLIIPTRLDEFRAFVERLHIDSDYLWVGGKRDEDHVWRWVSGLTLQEKEVPWDLGEPDNYDNQYHLCIRTNGNLKFHDCLEDAQLSAVCQLT